MNKKSAAILSILLAICVCKTQAGAQPDRKPDGPSADPIDIVRVELEYSTARLEPARLNDRFGIAVVFEGTADLHYYAKPESAPAPGFELKIRAESEAFEFGQAVFPKWTLLTNPDGSKTEVYGGSFNVFLPIKSLKAPSTQASAVLVEITGMACTSMICLPDFTKTVEAKIDWSARSSWKETTLEVIAEHGPARAAQEPPLSAWLALLLALVAGLTLNIMPCVLPVIPLKVLSIFEQAKESRARGIALGLSFCLGILLFFGAMAVANIILHIFYRTTLTWGEHFQSPLVLIGMSLLMIVLALFLFGVFAITLPGSVTGRAGARKGYAGSVGMGFFAAILSTPCSFGILAAAFAWAQTQQLPLATLAIMLIGIGMASPYAILTSTPALLKYVPKPGRWMEIFKQTMGFVLLIVAVWLIASLPSERQTGLLYYAVILAFCVWMWGGWVNLNTPKNRRRIIRTIALAIALLFAALFLAEPEPSQIEWRDYDRALVDDAVHAGRPVLVEFTAGWCANCKVVEKFVYSSRKTADLIRKKNVLPVKADTTLRDSPASIDLKQVYREAGVPVTVLFLPGEPEPQRLRGIFIGTDLRRLLNSLPEKPPDTKQQEDT